MRRVALVAVSATCHDPRMSELAVYTTSQVAARLYVEPSTVRLWVKRGKLRPYLITPGGHYRFLASDIDSITRSAA